MLASASVVSAWLWWIIFRADASFVSLSIAVVVFPVSAFFIVKGSDFSLAWRPNVPDTGLRTFFADAFVAGALIIGRVARAGFSVKAGTTRPGPTFAFWELLVGAFGRGCEARRATPGEIDGDGGRTLAYETRHDEKRQVAEPKVLSHGCVLHLECVL